MGNRATEVLGNEELVTSINDNVHILGPRFFTEEKGQGTGEGFYGSTTPVDSCTIVVLMNIAFHHNEVVDIRYAWDVQNMSLGRPLLCASMAWSFSLFFFFSSSLGLRSGVKLIWLISCCYVHWRVWRGFDVKVVDSGWLHLVDLQLAVDDYRPVS